MPAFSGARPAQVYGHAAPASPGPAAPQRAGILRSTVPGPRATPPKPAGPGRGAGLPAPDPGGPAGPAAVRPPARPADRALRSQRPLPVRGLPLRDRSLHSAEQGSQPLAPGVPDAAGPPAWPTRNRRPKNPGPRGARRTWPVAGPAGASP